MATAHSIKTPVTIGFQSLPHSRPDLVQHEKISSSACAFSERQLLDLRGSRVRVRERLVFLDGEEVSQPQFVEYSAKVLAVQFGSISDSVETSLLLLQDGYNYSDYVDVSYLAFCEVLMP